MALSPEPGDGEGGCGTLHREKRACRAFQVMVLCPCTAPPAEDGRADGGHLKAMLPNQQGGRNHSSKDPCREALPDSPLPQLWARIAAPSFYFRLLLGGGAHPGHMEVPRLGVESELQLLAYTTATETRDPRRICNLHHSSRQCWPGIEPSSSQILVRFNTAEP